MNDFTLGDYIDAENEYLLVGKFEDYTNTSIPVLREDGEINNNLEDRLHGFMTMPNSPFYELSFYPGPGVDAERLWREQKDGTSFIEFLKKIGHRGMEELIKGPPQPDEKTLNYKTEFDSLGLDGRYIFSLTNAAVFKKLVHVSTLTKNVLAAYAHKNENDESLERLGIEFFLRGFKPQEYYKTFNLKLIENVLNYLTYYYKTVEHAKEIFKENSIDRGEEFVDSNIMSGGFSCQYGRVRIYTQDWIDDAKGDKHWGKWNLLSRMDDPNLRNYTFQVSIHEINPENDDPNYNDNLETDKCILDIQFKKNGFTDSDHAVLGLNLPPSEVRTMVEEEVPILEEKGYEIRLSKEVDFY